jgi:hypothetical protein
MPKNVLHKIQYLCKNIVEVEWSGIILYEVVGSIKKLDTLQLILKDIIPMNKGNKAFTSYAFNEPKRDNSGYEDAHIDYMQANPKAMKWKIGHIHSHNSMNVFFSGTDMEELHDNAPSHDFYFSIIVNNYMDFMAKIAFVARAQTKTKKIPYIALDEKGKPYTIEEVAFTIDNEKLFLIDCVIDSPKEEITVDEAFANQVAHIIDKEKKAEEVRKLEHENKWKTPGHNGNGKVWQHPSKQTALDKAIAKSTTWFGGHIEDTPGFGKGFSDTSTDIEMFIVSLLRGGNIADLEVLSLEGTLEEIEALKETVVDGVELAEIAMTKFGDCFKMIFGEGKGEDHLFSILEETLEVLENEEVGFPWLAPMVSSFKKMILTLEKDEHTV